VTEKPQHSGKSPAHNAKRMHALFAGCSGAHGIHGQPELDGLKGFFAFTSHATGLTDTTRLALRHDPSRPIRQALLEDQRTLGLQVLVEPHAATCPSKQTRQRCLAPFEGLAA
jgi:hypothetical protein